MKYKKSFLFLIIFFICMPLFSQGAVESMFRGLGSGAVSGAGLGSIIPGLGTIGGGLIGAGIGAMFGGVTGAFRENEENKQKSIKYEDKYLESKAAAQEYESRVEQSEIALTSAQRKVTAYDEFISNYGDYRTQQEQALQQKGEQQFNQQMQNFSNIQTVIGATGQTGTSSAISGDVAKQGVEQLAGSDLTLNRTGGGTFSKIWENTERELSDKYSSSLLSKQDLFSVMENYRSSISKDKQSINIQKERSNKFKEESIKYKRKIN